MSALRLVAILFALILSAPLYADGISNGGGSITISGATIGPGGTYAPARTVSNPSSPTGTASTAAPVMMGLAGTVTPTTSGKVLILITGQIQQTTANDGCLMQIRFGTGTAPANAAAATGTTLGGAPGFFAPAANSYQTFTLQGLATGLTLSTAVWIDMGLQAVTGGTCNLFGLTVTALEM